MEAADQRWHAAGGHVAALRQNADHVGEREPDLSDMFRQIEQRPEAPVPDCQAVRGVEDGNPLFHLGKRRLQHVLIVLQGLGGLVEQPDGIGGRILCLLQDE